MNRQKLEHLIETLDFVRRWQVGQQEAVDREIAKAQERYRNVVGHFYRMKSKSFEYDEVLLPDRRSEQTGGGE